MAAFEEFKSGWRALLGAIVGVGSGLTGIVFYTHGVFVVPITAEFGWSRGDAQFAFSFVMISAALTGPIVGSLTDKFGSRQLALSGVLALGLTFAALSLTDESIRNYYLLWIVMSVLAAGTFPVTWTKGVNTWFDKNRGLALGITMMGTGLVAAAGPVYAASLIDNFGWRNAYQALGATILLFSLPISFLFFRERQVLITENANSPVTFGLSTTEAILSYKFWVLGFALLFVCFGVAGLIANFVPLLIDKGYEATEAASYAGFVGVMVIIGRLLVGYLIDRFWAPRIAFIFLILPFISCLILAQDQPSSLGITIAALAVGLAAGAELDLIAYMTSRYFGMKNYGQLYGGQFVFFAVGSGLAPALFGWWFDFSGNYVLILYISAVLFVLGSLMMLVMGKYPDFEKAK